MEKKQKRSREQQKEARREEIIMAALDLFIKKGYGGTKITDIASAVGMSTGLLFHYFESKEKLYECIVEYGVAGPEMIMQQSIEDPIEFFENAAETIFYYMEANRSFAKIFVLMQQVINQEPVTDKIAEMTPRIRTIGDSIPIIIKGQEMGEIRDGDPTALSVAFWGAIQGICEGYAMNPLTTLPEPGWLVDMLRKQ